jgi:hypothetical protein
VAAIEEELCADYFY